MRDPENGLSNRIRRWRSGGLVVIAALALAACSTPPLLPYSAETPPLVMVAASQAGVEDGRARFREIFCAVLEARGEALPDYRPCDEALARVGEEPLASGREVDLGPSQRRLTSTSPVCRSWANRSASTPGLAVWSSPNASSSSRKPMESPVCVPPMEVTAGCPSLSRPAKPDVASSAGVASSTPAG